MNNVGFECPWHTRLVELFLDVNGVGNRMQCIFV